MAFELVTGHAAQAHITAEQVSRFIQGVTVIDDTTVYRLNQGNDAALTVNNLTVSVDTGEVILHGFHVTNEASFDATLDATVDAAKSRIDKIVLEILQDDSTGIQYASVIIVQGTEASSPTPPATPSDSGDPTITLLGVGLLMTCTVTGSTIASYTDNTVLYAGSYVTQSDYDNDMGNTDISGVGDGTVTGAIEELDTDSTKVLKEVPWYATSDTAQSTAAKVATTAQSGFSLVTGAKVIVKFDATNTEAAPTLNVNSTGAKSIVGYGSTVPSLWWLAGDVVEFTYDGTNWIMQPTQGQVATLNSSLNNGNVEVPDIETVSDANLNWCNMVKRSGWIFLNFRFTASSTSPYFRIALEYAPLTYDNRNIEVCGRDLSDGNSAVTGWIGNPANTSYTEFTSYVQANHNYAFTVSYPAMYP